MTSRDQIAPRLRWDQHDWSPRKVPNGKFLWHNHIRRFRGTTHGTNAFRYWWRMKPINCREFERCECAVTDLPHYKIRGLGSGKCVSWQQVMRNVGMSEQQIRNLEAAE
jgi:hypothetical protein